MEVMIDAGHGRGTAGKQSPDGRFREWAWARRAAAQLTDMLRGKGFECGLVVPEDDDVALSERVRRVNAAGPRLLVSLHVNAAGVGTGWHSARGFSSYVSPGASSVARRFAGRVWELAAEAGFGGNRWRPASGYYSQGFYLLRRTGCPAVLTENLFMDNREDLALLEDDAVTRRLMEVHARAVEEVLR